MKISRKPQSQNPSQVTTTQLPERVGQNIDTIIALHKRHEQKVPKHQKTVETVTTFFGRPAFLYTIIITLFIWVAVNIMPRRFHLPRFDPPPFSSLQFLLTTGSLLMTTGVLIKQNREEKIAKQREQLSLQINLLSEQKIAKLIALTEELRRDIPEVRNRYDPEAEMMQEAADPHAVTIALEETFTQELQDL